jgi:hypothetical protein
MTLSPNEAARPYRRYVVIGTIGLVVAAASLGFGLALGRQGAPEPSSSSPIDQIDVALPHRIATVPLVNQSGRPTDL